MENQQTAIDKLEPDLSPGEQAGQIIFHGIKERMAKVREGKVKKPVKELNTAARERLERQTSELMAKLNRLVNERNLALKTGLDVLEMARCAIYTEGLAEVEQMFLEAAGRFRVEFPQEANSMMNLSVATAQVRKLENNC